MKVRARTWLTGYFCIVIAVLFLIGALVYHIDPAMHYHYPYIERYHYELSDQRWQNNGITKHFDYDAVITGSSMTEQFKTSEVDDLFGVRSIKVPYSGASYKEVNDNLKIALQYHPDLKLVIRGLDMNRFFDDCSAMEYELEEYPSYLYNENAFDDVNYLFNRDAIIETYKLLAETLQGTAPGITSFDEYSIWQDHYTFGINAVCPNGICMEGLERRQVHLSNEEKISDTGEYLCKCDLYCRGISRGKILLFFSAVQCSLVVGSGEGWNGVSADRGGTIYY